MNKIQELVQEREYLEEELVRASRELRDVEDEIEDLESELHTIQQAIVIEEKAAKAPLNTPQDSKDPRQLSWLQ